MTRRFVALSLTLVAALALPALTASGAMATEADFAASHYPASTAVQGESTFTLQTPLGKLTCPKEKGQPFMTGTAVLTQKSNSLTAENVTLENCHFTILTLPLTIDMNGCDFRYTSGVTIAENTSTGSLEIVNCQNPETGITMTVGAEGKICHTDIPEQTFSSGSVTYHNVETPNGIEDVVGTVESVIVDMNLTGGTNCKGSTGEAKSAEGTLDYDFRLTAVNGGAPQDITIEDT